MRHLAVWASKVGRVGYEPVCLAIILSRESDSSRTALQARDARKCETNRWSAPAHGRIEPLDARPSCLFVPNRFPRDVWVGAVADQRSPIPLECWRFHVPKFMEQVVIAFGNHSASWTEWPASFSGAPFEHVHGYDNDSGLHNPNCIFGCDQKTAQVLRGGVVIIPPVGNLDRCGSRSRVGGRPRGSARFPYRMSDPSIAKLDAMFVCFFIKGRPNS